MGASRGGAVVERATAEPGVPRIPRYERPHEAASAEAPAGPCVPYADTDAAIAGSALSPGARTLLRGLLRVGTTRVFGGGGVGIEYASLLKTAARPEYLFAHAEEAAAHLRAARADVLIVPGMSAYPVAAMYAIVAGLPAIFLKKAKLGAEEPGALPAGSFVIPSYTGDGDVLMHADADAAQDIVDAVVLPQLAAQADHPHPTLTLRAAGADDIIDKATMAEAVGVSAVALGEAAIADVVRRHRAATGDVRPIATRVELAGWVTPLIKGYNRPSERLEARFGLRPFAGITVTSVHLDPPAIGVEGVGVVGFRGR